MQRFLDYDPITKRTRTFHSNGDGTEFTIESKHDVSDIIDLNKAQYNAADSGWKGEMHTVARIPLHVLEEWRKQGIVDPDGDVTDDKRLMRVLSDPTYQAFRTKPGRIL